MFGRPLIKILPSSICQNTAVIVGATVLRGYNVLGDGTPQALLPILTGRTEQELPEARRGFTAATTVDAHPWIWKQLRDVGYVTQVNYSFSAAA